MPDVVVVGAGHNALVGACYLARAGLDVQVVERDEVLGGAVSTVERFPGFRMDRGATAHIMIRHTGIVEELDLAGVGLRYRDMDPWGYAPVGDGDGITFWVDLARTCADIERVCGARDADAYARFAREWGERNERVFAAFAGPPSPWRLARAMWGVGRGGGGAGGAGGAELARQFLQPADALLDATFTDERLRTALAWLAAQAGPPPHETGTADLLGWNAMLHRRAPGHPVGGSGALTAALAARLVADGGKVRLGDPATRIEFNDGGVTAVHTAAGDRLATPAVLAGCHVQATLALLDSPAAHAAARGRLRVGNGLGVALRLATDALPAYPGAPAGVGRGLQLLCRSREQLRLAYGQFGAGRPPEHPPLVVLAPTALDPDLAPAGAHTVTVWAQWYPYALAGGTSWDAVEDREADRLLAELDGYAPGFAAGVRHRLLQTPLRLERELALPRGNVMHLEMGLDAMFGWRPLPEWSGYRGPVAGLYLCGASTHPGGGVSGASGRSAARVLLADRRRPRRRRRH